jgi:hypothetical protein
MRQPLKMLLTVIVRPLTWGALAKAVQNDRPRIVVGQLALDRAIKVARLMTISC